MVARSELGQDYYTLSEVAEITGLSRKGLNHRMAADGITTYLDPADRRRRLITRDDIEKLIEIRPAPRRTTAA